MTQRCTLILVRLQNSDHSMLCFLTKVDPLDHCLDKIRLSLMCSGDMTPARVVWSENRNGILPLFGTTHTCRDYDALRNWSVDRDAVDPEKALENAARLKDRGI
jgi:hypothetical protein